MGRAFLFRCCQVACAASLSMGCGLFGEDTPNLRIDIDASENTLTRPTEYPGIAVTVENLGDARATWGPGSSSCQLRAAVVVAGIEFRTPEIRGCTADLAEQGVDPGETRIEAWVWDGTIFDKEGNRVQLPPGSYKLAGAAGPWVGDASVTITIKQQPQ